MPSCTYCRTSEHAGIDCPELVKFEQCCLQIFSRPNGSINDLDSFFYRYYLTDRGYHMISNYGDKHNCVGSTYSSKCETILCKLKRRIMSLYLQQNDARLIWEMAARMRQEILQQQHRPSPAINFEVRVKKEADEEETNDDSCCGICYERTDDKDYVSYDCNHKCCKRCFKIILSKLPQEVGPQCAFCRANIERVYVSDDSIRNEVTNSN